MTDTVLTRGLKEQRPFPDSVFESMWKTCSCGRGNRKLASRGRVTAQKNVLSGQEALRPSLLFAQALI